MVGLAEEGPLVVNSHYPFNTILQVIQKRQVSFGFNMSQSCDLKTLCRPHHYHCVMPSSSGAQGRDKVNLGTW
jgi:hypothetical protein